MLIDTGCTKTMVSADYLHPDCLNHASTEKILCVNGESQLSNSRNRAHTGSMVTKCQSCGCSWPVLLGTDIYDLSPSNPVMVTTRAQTRKKCSTTVRPGNIPEEGTSESCQVVDNSTSENISNDGCSRPTLEMETIEQRREETPTSTSQRLNALEASADDIRQWQAADPTLTKACDEAEEKESDDRVGFYYNNGISTGNGDHKGQQKGI